MYELIPAALKSVPNWICWKAVPDPTAHSGIKKIPVNPRTGGNAMSNNPSTWADFDTAVSVSANFSGLGFMFGSSGFFGVDLDDMPADLDKFKDGDTNNIVSEFIYGLQSYAEYSYSKNGIHIICKGTLPKGGRKKKTKDGGFEMYESGRFFVMTGECCSEFADIAECTERIKPLHAKYIGGGREPQPKINARPVPTNIDDIVKLAVNAKGGDKFKTLYDGDFSAYGSQSEADMAFCNMLAFWTGCDADKMDCIFRQSGLMRDKWDRRQSGSTYGAITIQKAIAGCNNIYTPKSEYKLTFKNSNTDISAAKEGEIAADTQRIYTFDDMGNARRFFDLFGEEIRYCYPEKKWYFYDGRRWLIDNSGTIERMADKSVEAVKAENRVYAAQCKEEIMKAFEKHLKSCRSRKSKKAMIEEAQHYIPVLPVQFDRFKMHLNTPGGVINLRTGEILPHSPIQYLSKITAVEYTTNADCPRWIEFLNEIFGGDKELIRYIQKAVGYSLTGETAEQCAFFLYGTGKNGKSTFIDVIRDLFGDYAANIQPETIMIRSNQSSAINSDIARLKGARLVTSVEPNEGVRINEGLLKQLTGDDTVTARKLYSEEFEFKPEFKLWMATNHKPVIRGTDLGIWRRIHLIPFTVQIPNNKVDRNLKHKLCAEMSGIFRWAVDGCLLYQKEGLKMPKAIEDSVKEYRREMDVISAFIEDVCTIGGKVQSSALYNAYVKWADENNEYCMSSTKFSMEMSKRFERIKGRGYNYYQGLSLLLCDK